MSVKEKVLEAVRNLPPDATWEDVAEQYRFMRAVEAGLAQAEQGRVVSREQVKAELEKWLA